MRLGGLRLTVTAVDPAAAPPPGLRVRTGYHLVAADVRYRNLGSGPMVVSPYDWALTAPSGAVYGAAAADGGLPQRQLASGQGLQGRVWFQVPGTVRSGLVLNFNAELGYATASVRVPS
jgi:hypothetical protein